MMRIYLMGRHAHRTPFNYAPYKRLFQTRFDYVSDSKDADVILFAYVLNIDENAEELSKLLAKKPDLKLVVISEEPLWDTTNSGDFRKRHNIRRIGEYTFKYSVINHHTSQVYKFDQLPYFLTTDDEYYLRYAHEFAINGKLSARAYSDVWSKPSIRYAFFAENRDLAKKYSISYPDIETFGLSVYRTDIAKSMPSTLTMRVGQGWGTSVTRQQLPDWHLDKILTLQGKTFIISAIENTNQPDYISEKIFDAFACRGVPLYWGSASHRIHSLIPSDSFINLFGLSSEQAVEKLTKFKHDAKLLDSFRGAQVALSERFRRYDDFLDERFGFFQRFSQELDIIVKEQA